ncbi:hypothetical protein B296_00044956 [Ensete ventricosum]|uniref:Phosphatidic acid phosphatase type 2/haloperoxidase domain-containing protein n=1 Tax=Ensete ventricosum TaxID=4639 RepID=A0A426XUR0_ENSVE|nr:hypothetical protein B296_00044956 [Ensete ventricosum]
MVSISLVNDYLHHWGDVFAGGLLGSYRHHLIRIHGTGLLRLLCVCMQEQWWVRFVTCSCWGTHAYLQVSTETRNGGRTWRNTGEGEGGLGTHSTSCEDEEGGDASTAEVSFTRDGHDGVRPEEQV